MTDDQIDLLSAQVQIGMNVHVSCVDFSLVETISRVMEAELLFPEHAAAAVTELNKLLRRFKVSDKVICHIRIQLFAKHHK